MIQILTKAAMHHLLTSDTEHRRYTPTGMFLSHENGAWVACDNSTGDAWTEEFDTLEDAVDWLNSDGSKEEFEERKRRLRKPAFQGPDEPTALAHTGDKIPEVQRPKKQEPQKPKDPLDRQVTLRDVVRLVQWFRLEVNPCILDNKSKQFEAWVGGSNA